MLWTQAGYHVVSFFLLVSVIVSVKQLEMCTRSERFCDLIALIINCLGLLFVTQRGLGNQIFCTQKTGAMKGPLYLGSPRGSVSMIC